jgi:small subunit ribosomal protein S18
VSSEPTRNASESSRPPSRGSRPAFGGGGRPSRSGGGGGRGGGGGGGKRYFFRRRKVCKFCADKIDYIDYKDVKLLSQFVPERGKLLPRRMFGTCAEHQRKLSVAIKRARHIALLPFMGD